MKTTTDDGETRDAMAVLLYRMRRLVRALRHTPDRLLHGRRRRLSLAIVPPDRPALVLFICYGNICRSPYAAEAFRRLVDDEEVQVQSAGFVGPGRSVPAPGQAVAGRRGIELSRHRSQLITPELVQSADLVVVMDEKQRRVLSRRFGRDTGLLVLGDLDPERIDTRTVRDPFNQTETVFEAVYDRIDRCLATLVRALPAESVA